LSPIVCNSPRFEGGPLIGLNVCQIDGDFRGGYNKAGFVGGAFVCTDFRDKWGGQMEIRFAEKGSGPSKRNPNRYIIRLRYVEIPLLITYNFNNKVDLQAGGAPGFLFSAQGSEGYGYEDLEEFVIFLDACVGGLYKLSGHFGVNVRFSYSVTPIYAQYPGATGRFACITM
jgi:hypothetical protein